MRKFSCLTWNIAKRIKYSEEQVNFINSFKPDVVALQEVLISSDKKLKDLLSKNYKNRRFGGPRPDTPKLIKNYKIEDPGGPREIIDNLYPQRSPKLVN